MENHSVVRNYNVPCCPEKHYIKFNDIGLASIPVWELFEIERCWEKNIENLRGELSILSELERRINVKGKMCRKVKRKYKLDKKNKTRVKETVKQRIQFKAQRMRIYEKCRKFCHQNLI